MELKIPLFEFYYDGLMMLMLHIDDIESFREYVPIDSEEVAREQHLHGHPANLLNIKDVDLSFDE